MNSSSSSSSLGRLSCKFQMQETNVCRIRRSKTSFATASNMFLFSFVIHSSLVLLVATQREQPQLQLLAASSTNQSSALAADVAQTNSNAGQQSAPNALNENQSPTQASSSQQQQQQQYAHSDSKRDQERPVKQATATIGERADRSSQNKAPYSPPYFYSDDDELASDDDANASGPHHTETHTHSHNHEQQRDASDLNFSLMNAPHDKLQAVKQLLRTQGPLFAGSAAETGSQHHQPEGNSIAMQCTHKGRQYSHGQTVPISEQPCLNCTCVRAILQCYLRVCPPVVSLEAHKKMQALAESGDSSSQLHHQTCRLHKEPNRCCPSVKCEPATEPTIEASFSPSNSSLLSSSSSHHDVNYDDGRQSAPTNNNSSSNNSTATASDSFGEPSLPSANLNGAPTVDGALVGQVNAPTANQAATTLSSAGQHAEIGANYNQQLAPASDANTVSLISAEDRQTSRVVSINSNNNNRADGAIELRQPFLASNRSVNEPASASINSGQQQPPSYEHQQQLQQADNHQLPKLTVINGASGQRDSILLITSNPHHHHHHHQSHNSNNIINAGQHSQLASAATTDKPYYPVQEKHLNGSQHLDYSNALLEALLETVYSSAAQLNGLNLQGSCMINGSFYVEGSAVLPENNNAYCQYCYCIRQKIMCVKPKCHLSISGCSPKYSNEFACCPTSYSCSSSSSQSGAQNGLQQPDLSSAIAASVRAGAASSQAPALQQQQAQSLALSARLASAAGAAGQQSLAAKLSAAIESISRLSEPANVEDGLSWRQADHSLSPAEMTTRNRSSQQLLPVAVIALMSSVGLPIDAGSTGGDSGSGGHTLINRDTLASGHNATNRAQPIGDARDQQQEKAEVQGGDLGRNSGDEEAPLAAPYDERRQPDRQYNLTTTTAGFATNTTTERPSSVSDFLEPMNRLGPLVMLPTTPSSCTENGRQYAIGEQIPTLESCKHCYCGLEGMKECKMIECGLKIAHSCRPVTPEGHCCPIRYDCPPQMHNNNNNSVGQQQQQQRQVSSLLPSPIVANGLPINSALISRNPHQQAVGAQAREAMHRYRSEEVSLQAGSGNGRVSDMSYSFRDISQCKNGTGLSDDCVHFLNSTPVAPVEPQVQHQPTVMFSSLGHHLQQGNSLQSPTNLTTTTTTTISGDVPVVKGTRIIDNDTNTNRPGAFFSSAAQTTNLQPTTTSTGTRASIATNEPTFSTGNRPDTTTTTTTTTTTSSPSGSVEKNDSFGMTEELNKFIMQINLHHQQQQQQNHSNNQQGNRDTDYSVVPGLTTLGDNATQEMMINDQRLRMVDYHSVQAPSIGEQQRQQQAPSPIPSGIVGIPSIEPESIKNLVETNRLAIANGEIVTVEPPEVANEHKPKPAQFAMAIPDFGRATPTLANSNGGVGGQRDSRSTNAHRFANDSSNNNNIESHGSSHSAEVNDEPHEHRSLFEEDNDTAKYSNLGEFGNLSAQPVFNFKENDQPELMANISDDYIDATDGPAANHNSHLNYNNTNNRAHSLRPSMHFRLGQTQTQGQANGGNNNDAAYNIMPTNPTSMVIFDDELGTTAPSHNSSRTSPGDELLEPEVAPSGASNLFDRPNSSSSSFASTVATNSENSSSSDSITTPPASSKPTTGTPIGIEVADRNSETSSWLRSLSGFMHSFGRRLSGNGASSTSAARAAETSGANFELHSASSAANSEADSAHAQLAREENLLSALPSIGDSSGGGSSGYQQIPTARSRSSSSFLNQLLNSVIGTSEPAQSDSISNEDKQQEETGAASLVMRPLANVLQADNSAAKFSNQNMFPDSKPAITAAMTIIDDSTTFPSSNQANGSRARPILSPYEPAASMVSPSELKIVTAAMPNDPEFSNSNLNEENEKRLTGSVDSKEATGLERPQQQQQHYQLDVDQFSKRSGKVSSEDSTVEMVNSFTIHKQNRPSMSIRYHGGNEGAVSSESNAAAAASILPANNNGNSPTFSVFRTIANNGQHIDIPAKTSTLTKPLTCYNPATNKTYQPNEIIAKDDPCKTCSCILGEEMCQTLICPLKPAENCSEERRPGECCANYLCGNSFTQPLASSSNVSSDSTIRFHKPQQQHQTRNGNVLELMGPSARLMAAVNSVVPDGNNNNRPIQFAKPNQRALEIGSNDNQLENNHQLQANNNLPYIPRPMLFSSNALQTSSQNNNINYHQNSRNTQQPQAFGQVALSVLPTDKGIPLLGRQQQQSSPSLPSYSFRTSELAGVLPPHLRFRPSLQSSILNGNSHSSQGHYSSSSSNNNNHLDSSKILFSSGQPANQRFLVNNQQQQFGSMSNQQTPGVGGGNSNNNLHGQQPAANNWLLRNFGSSSGNSNSGSGALFSPFAINNAALDQQSNNHQQRVLGATENSIVRPSVLLHPQRSPSLLISPSSSQSSNGLQHEQQQTQRRVSNDEQSTWKQMTTTRVNFQQEQPQMPNANVIPSNVLISRMSSVQQQLIPAANVNQQQKSSNSNSQSEPIPSVSMATVNAPSTSAIATEGDSGSSQAAIVPLVDVNRNSLSHIASLDMPAAAKAVLKEIPYEVNEVNEKGNSRVLLQAQPMEPFSLNSNSADVGFRPISAPTSSFANRQQQQQISSTTQTTLPSTSSVITITSTALPDSAGSTQTAPDDLVSTTMVISTPPSTTTTNVAPASSLSTSTPTTITTDSVASTATTTTTTFNDNNHQHQADQSISLPPIDVNQSHYFSHSPQDINSSPMFTADSVGSQGEQQSTTGLASTLATSTTTTITESTPFEFTENHGSSQLSTTQSPGQSSDVGGAELFRGENKDSQATTARAPISSEESQLTNEPSVLKPESAINSDVSSAAATKDSEIDSDPLAMFRVSECNIYGRLYNVGQTIEELSDFCKHCTCTSKGVDCQNKCR